MNNRKIRLPKDGLQQPDDLLPTELDGDVEGHRLPTTAPPSLGARRSPGHGGENIPTIGEDEDDVEGHRNSIRNL
jgi:hypothetical protein